MDKGQGREWTRWTEMDGNGQDEMDKGQGREWTRDRDESYPVRVPSVSRPCPVRVPSVSRPCKVRVPSV
jgi:hypothetical protein